MSVGPFPVHQVIQRLADEAAVLLYVGGAADLQTAIDQSPHAAVAAYVTTAELGGRAKYTGPLTIQNADVTIRVVLMVRNHGGERAGTGAREQMDLEVIPAVRRALIGWTPQDAFDSMHFQAGRDEAFRAGTLVTQQVFGSSYRIQQQAKP